MKFLIEALLTRGPKFKPNDFCDFIHFGCLLRYFWQAWLWGKRYYYSGVNLKVSNYSRVDDFGRYTYILRGPFTPKKFVSYLILPIVVLHYLR